LFASKLAPTKSITTYTNPIIARLRHAGALNLEL